MKSQQEVFPYGKHKASLCAWLAVAVMLLLPGRGMAQTYQMTDGGSTADVDITPGSGAGMDYWTVDTDPDVNQLDLQWFYYSINGGTVAAIDSIGLYQSANDPSDVYVDYANSQISIAVTYSLQGGGSGSGNADVSESIAIVNESGTAFNNVQFFQYSHFNLLQDSGNSISIYEDGAGGYDEAYQAVGSTALAEGIIQPDANYAEAGAPAGPASVLSDIYNSTGGNHLIGNYDTMANLSAGPGDVAWAFEWDTGTLAANGGEFDIAKDKSLSIAMVPEPSTIALIALGLGACGLVRRRQS